jgi:uncharacterized protein (TIGR02284 family)
MDNQQLSALLYDIALINLERASAYEDASFQNQLFSVELRGTFALLANQSRQNVYMLKEFIEKLGIKRNQLSTSGAELFQQWKLLPATFSNIDHKSMLESGEAGEEAIQIIYRKALDMPVGRSITELLQNQLKGLESSHNVIKEITAMRKLKMR